MSRKRNSEPAEAKNASKPAEQEQQEQPKEEETFVLTAEEMQAAKERIEKLQKEKEETVQLLQRNQADFDNYRRRNAGIRADSLEEGKRDCIEALLPVLDNFERALAVQAEGEAAAYMEGIALVYRQLTDALQKQGLSEIETEGKFDPNLHNAVMQEAVEGKESGEILAVFQKGYRVGDRIIRHSMVKVAE